MKSPILDMDGRLAERPDKSSLLEKSLLAAIGISMGVASAAGTDLRIENITNPDAAPYILAAAVPLVPTLAHYFIQRAKGTTISVRKHVKSYLTIVAGYIIGEGGYAVVNTLNKLPGASDFPSFNISI